MNENKTDVSDEGVKRKQYRRLVLWTVEWGFFWPHDSQEWIAKHDFAGSEIIAEFEDAPHASGILIENYREMPPVCLAEVLSTVSLILSSEKRNNIDFVRGLVLCEDEVRGSKWEERALLLKDGTFISCEVPRK